ncbi:MAG: methyl-accepting chemotaxis protein [Gammaproteobacteria bacterium]
MKFKTIYVMVLLGVLAISSYIVIGYNYHQVMSGSWDSNHQAAAAIMFGILMVALIIGLGIRVWHSFTQFNVAMKSAKAGDFEVRLKTSRNNELSMLAADINDLLEERAQTEHKVKEENAAILALLQGVYKFSQRDLTMRLEVKEDITAPLADSLNIMADETAKVLNGVVNIANDVAQAAQQVKTQSDTVIDVASDEQRQVEQSAVQLGEASEAMSAITTLAKGCNESADRAIRATENSQDSVLNTIQGITGIRTTIRETEKRIKRLGERSQDISGIVSLINSIAERTHILALNASIYAASAGETGKGFVVIADEIQRLAENSREATSKISTLVNNIQAETADTVTTMNEAISQVVRGTQLAEQAGTAMRETHANTSDLVDKVQQIAEKSNNQARVTHELRDRSEHIKASTEKTNAELRDQSEQTDLLVQYSDDLLQAVGVFTLPEAESLQQGKK